MADNLKLKYRLNMNLYHENYVSVLTYCQMSVQQAISTDLQPWNSVYKKKKKTIK